MKNPFIIDNEKTLKRKIRLERLAPISVVLFALCALTFESLSLLFGILMITVPMILISYSSPNYKDGGNMDPLKSGFKGGETPSGVGL